MNGERFEKVKVVEDAFYEVKFIIVDQYSEPIERVEDYMSGKNLIKIFMSRIHQIIKFTLNCRRRNFQYQKFLLFQKFIS